MFIAIDAKADVTNSKKGRLTPTQHAQLNAWCLASKTGILDCFGRCEVTPLTYTPSSNSITITFKHGYIVICGRIIECEENTKYTLTGLPNTGEVTGKIILRFNLAANGNSEFEITSTTKDLVQEDLNDNPITGKYEFELYSYTATSSSVVLTRTNTDYIPDIGGKLNQFITVLTGTGVVGSGNPPLQGYNTGKGTIEQRLTKLGFNSLSNISVPLSFEYSGANYNIGYIKYSAVKREGYCISEGKIQFYPSSTSFPSSSPFYRFYGVGGITATGTNATKFIPEHDISIYLPIKFNVTLSIGSYTTTIAMRITFKTDGTVEALCNSSFPGSSESATMVSGQNIESDLGYKLKDI